MPDRAKRALPIVVLLFSLAVLTVSALAQVDNGAVGQVRFVHAIPGAAAIDVYTDGQLTVSGLEFGAASEDIRMPSGERQITVTSAGLTTRLWSQTVSVMPDSALALIASATDPLGFQPFPLDLNPLDLGEARITAVHAINGAPSASLVLANGSEVASGLTYNTPFGTLDVPAGTYEMGLIPAGGSLENPLIAPVPLSFNSGSSYMVIAYGTPVAPRLLLISSSVKSSADAGFVRFVHGVPGAPPVSILLNNTVVVPALAFGGSATDFIALPEGQYALSIRQPGGSDDILQGTLAVARGERITAAALGTLTSFGVQRFTDIITGISAEEGVLGLINALPAGTVSAAFVSGEELIAAVDPGEAASAAVAATTAEITVMVQGERPTDLPLSLPGGVYGGVYYTAVVLPDEAGLPSLIVLDPISIAESVASAPGDTVLALEQPTTAPTEAMPIAVLPTAVPGQEVAGGSAAGGSSEVVLSQPTPMPTTTPLPQIPAPTPRPILPSARVQLDPGANLQLRQYPSSSALSLGLAPSGSLLNVLGRQGEPLPPIGVTPDPLATPFVDPASLLQPNQDLDPAVTWLFVEYPTPDGGLIEAWVNALYVAVSSPQGTRQRLADLPTIPANRAGEAVNTAVQSPSGRQDVVTVTIINLDPGVNLNIRRTIGVDGEALARVPAGTQTLFRGISANGQWVFVRYTAPDGGQVDGWISATYAQFELNGRITTVQDLLERNLLTVVPDDTRGGATSSPAVPAAPTVNPLRDAVVAEVILDPGANLHLRRRANRDSESLALIPAGTQVVVNGRNEIGDWLQVTFEGIDGWVSTQYVFVTRNGRRVDIQTLPVVPEVTPTITPIGFTASPTPPGFVNPAATQPTAPAGSGFPTGVDDPNLDPVPGG
ncbi:MAG: DUF4397 domain-containing protein [Candidatus Flexifilum sp.]